VNLESLNPANRRIGEIPESAIEEAAAQRASWRRIGLLGLLVASLSCGGSPLESTPPAPGGDLGGTLRVSGQVLDFFTGASVPGVTVAFGDATGMTNAAGLYSIPLASTGTYYPKVDGVAVGISRFPGASYRGDLFVHTGTCVSRYGTIADMGGHRPIAGATVSLLGKKTLTGTDGWYRLDFDCPADAWVGFNTTFLYVSHPDYAEASQVVGRGVSQVSRLDVEMQRK
jgi:hypothetical protein